MIRVWNDDLLPKRNEKVIVGNTQIDLMFQVPTKHRWYFVHKIRLLYSFVPPPCVQFEFNIDIIAPTKQRWFV